MPQTSTRALTNVTMPYALKIATHGLAAAARADAALLAGINVYDGHLTCEPVAHAHGLTYARVADLLA